MSEKDQPKQPLFDAARANRLMGEAGIDILFASRRANVAYLTDSFNILYWDFPDVAHCLDIEDDGCEAPFYFASIARDPGCAAFAVTHANRPQVFGNNWIADVRIWCGRQRKPAVDVIADALSERRADGQTIGIEANHLPGQMLDALRSRFPRSRFVDARPVLWGMRAVKTEAELARQRQAYRIGEAVYGEVINLLRRQPDVSVGEVRALQMSMATQRGCPPLHFGYVFPQANNKLAWNLPNGQATKIERGDVLLLDLGLIWRGYTTDFGRNVTLGRPSAQVREMYDKTLECRQRLVEKIRPGVRVCDFYKAGCAIREKLGLPSRAALGHSLGVECHEQPSLSADYDTIIEEGMTLVPELVENAGNTVFLLEDGGVVTANGWETLSLMGTELVEI